ncbi:MAG: RNA polymerase sigma factor [Thermoanaerobaculia bacterium]
MTTSTVPREISLMRDVDDAAARPASSLMCEEEFRAFYERTARGVWLYLSRITGDRQLADDLLQEAFYRFHRAGASHESDRHRRNSLYQIATNVARDAWRRRGGVIETQLDDADAPGGTTEERLHARTDVARAMERLSPQQREMLWLAYANGSSHEEIAEVTGVAPGSVKSLLFRARKKLAAVLGAMNGERAR